jgi:uncharacterized coiled-coil protein SlyX
MGIDPISILNYVSLAERGLEMALKAKNKFFSKSKKGEIAAPATLESLQAALAEQNDLIVELSKALAATAETLKRAQRIANVALLMAALSLCGLAYVLIR